MSAIVEETKDSIIEDVRGLKEQNAAKYGYDFRKIAEAARANQRQHPERMVTRIPANGGPPVTRSVPREEL